MSFSGNRPLWLKSSYIYMNNIISVLKDLNDSSTRKTSAGFLVCSSLHRFHMNRLKELCFAGDQ